MLFTLQGFLPGDEDALQMLVQDKLFASKS